MGLLREKGPGKREQGLDGFVLTGVALSVLTVTFRILRLLVGDVLLRTRNFGPLRLVTLTSPVNALFFLLASFVREISFSELVVEVLALQRASSEQLVVNSTGTGTAAFVPHHSVLRFCLLTLTTQTYVFFLLSFVCVSFMVIGGSLQVYLLGSLAASVVNQMKLPTTALASWMVFGNSISGLQHLGTGFLIAGLALYTWVRLQEKTSVHNTGGHNRGGAGTRVKTGSVVGKSRE